MGKGDKKTKRGKITIGSYGNSRAHKVAQPVIEAGEKKTKTKKTATKAKK
jgi:30S ribosomal protein S31